jgi:hypothetical protein
MKRVYAAERHPPRGVCRFCPGALPALTGVVNVESTIKDGPAIESACSSPGISGPLCQRGGKGGVARLSRASFLALTSVSTFWTTIKDGPSGRSACRSLSMDEEEMVFGSAHRVLLTRRAAFPIVERPQNAATVVTRERG